MTRLLEAVERGEQYASEQLLPKVYDELRRLAQQRLANERPGQTLQATALVHEVYLRLVGDSEVAWASRGHFYAAASEAMRRILIDSARRKMSLKRGGEFHRVDASDLFEREREFDAAELLSLDEALRRLESEDTEAHRVVMLRFFGGLTIEEAAQVMGVSVRTAKRNWSYARAWLQRELECD